MEFKTKISTVKAGRTIVRGKNLADLAVDQSFVKNIYFILTGKEATDNIEKMLNIIFSLSIDHGFGAVSTLALRIATSAKVSLQQSLIAALSAMGHAHGGACEDAAVWYEKNIFQGIGAEQAVKQALANKEKIPGYGHSIMQNDERIKILMDHAKKLKLHGKSCQFAEEIEQEIIKQKGKKIPLNIDGGIAAVVLDLGLPCHITTGLFIIGRLPGLLAHIKEEIEQDNRLRRLKEEEIDYLG